MKRTLATVLCVLMLLSVMLAGCQTKDPLLGTWKGKVDLTEALNETIAGADASMANYFTFKDLSMDITMTFNEDKTCSLVIDKDSLNTMMEQLAVQMGEGMTKMLEDILSSYGMEMTVDEYMTMLGMDMETLIKDSLESAITEETFASLEREGTYKTEEGKLYITDDADGEFDEEDATGYTLEGNTLKIMASEEMTEDEEYAELLKYVFPLELTKVAESE